jgi:succinate-semialdehyde dehydrogenase/glutarate-semialdehyde dehydrogenase
MLNMAAYPELELYIGGEWRTASGAPVVNPADESVLGTVPHASRTDLDDALAAAEQGFQVGNLSINHFVASSAKTPFGGVKDSGFGRERGIEGLQCYTVVKNVSHLTA